MLGMALLTAGGCIYLLQRPTSLLLFRVVDALGAKAWLDGVRETVSAWPEFVVYSLPGGLWSAAYVLLADVLFSSFSTATRLAWTAVIPAAGLLSELMQAVGLCPGTPDAADAWCYVLPYIIYVITLKWN